MSNKKDTKIICPNCKHHFKFPSYSIIDAVKDPELTQKVANLSLFRFKCPECGYEGELIYPFVFNDDEDKILLLFVPRTYNEADMEGFDALASDCIAYKKGYLFRYVNDRNSFAEKLNIFYHDLDDRVIEVYKLVNREHWNKIHPGFMNAYLINDCQKGLCFCLFNNKADVLIEPFDQAMYQKVKDTYFYDANLRYRDISVVDSRWALEYLTQFEKVS